MINSGLRCYQRPQQQLQLKTDSVLSLSGRADKGKEGGMEEKYRRGEWEEKKVKRKEGKGGFKDQAYCERKRQLLK